MNKPKECLGCPMYQDGKGFVPDEIIAGAKVFVLGQNPGEEEEATGRPFVGKTGQIMTQTYFPAGNLIRGENVSIGNVLRCRWEGSNNLPTGKTLQQAVKHCTQAYLRIPEEVELVVAQGSLALRCVSPGGSLSITDIRGFLVPGGFNASQSDQASEGTEIEELQSQQVRQQKTRTRRSNKKAPKRDE